MASSDDDAATEALMAQLVAEDLGESYQTQSAPIGASYHDYEEPLSSYERQCLDAEENPDEAGEEGSGWGPDDPDGASSAAAANESSETTERSAEGTWDSRFTDDDGQVRELATSVDSSPDEDENESDPDPRPRSSDEEHPISPARVVSLPTRSAPKDPADQARNVSDPITLPSRPIGETFSDLMPIPSEPLAISDTPRHRKPFVPDPSTWESMAEYDNGPDYASYQGKGKAVRAYDEFKRGARNRKRERPDLTIADRLDDNEQDDADSNSDRETDKVRRGELRFIHIPWPHPEPDEILLRREDAEVVEIRVGDDETLESILRDISLREERKRKGKGVEGRQECVGQVQQPQQQEEEEGGEGKEEARAKKDVAVWW